MWKSALNITRLCVLAMTGFPLLVLTLGIVRAALGFAFELEHRESTVWLHVLAQTAGIDIYDHSRVAFTNMNHGPIESLIKFWIYTLMPRLEPASVIRFFVPIVPVAAFFAALSFLKNRLLVCLVLSLGLYLLLLEVDYSTLLIGRSDPTALVFYFAMVWMSGRCLTRPNRSISWFLLGTVGAVTLATCWRFLPAVGALLVATGWDAFFEREHPDRWKSALSHALWAGAGLALVVVLILGVQFRFDWPLYYAHFFGFFGFKISPASFYSPFPQRLWVEREYLFSLLLASLTALMIVSRRMKAMWVWLVLGIACWGALSYGLYRNASGGGLRYFAPGLVYFWAMALRLLQKREKQHRYWEWVVCFVFIFGLPYKKIERGVRQLTDAAPTAARFVAEATEIAHGEKILTEHLFLILRKYRDEAIDMGDVNEGMSHGPVFDAAFAETVKRYTLSLTREPPRFILHGGLASNPLLQLLFSGKYHPALHLPQSPLTYGWPPDATLYQLKDAGEKPM